MIWYELKSSNFLPGAPKKQAFHMFSDAVQALALTADAVNLALPPRRRKESSTRKPRQEGNPGPWGQFVSRIIRASRRRNRLTGSALVKPAAFILTVLHLGSKYNASPIFISPFYD